MLPKKKISELLTKYKVEKEIVDFYVEGNTDKKFYSHHFKELGKSFRFIDMSEIDFSEYSDVFPDDLEENNRDKVIFLLNKINQIHPECKAYGIIDKDIIEYSRGFENLSPKTFTTDFGCLEAYFVGQKCMEKFIAEYANELSLTIINRLCELAAKATLLILVEKNNHLSIQKTPIDTNYKPKKDVFELDEYIKACLNKSSLHCLYDELYNEVLGLEIDLNDIDPKNYFNGHYFMEFLRLYLNSVNKKKYQHLSQDFLSLLLELNVETKFLEDYQLFKKIQTI